MLPAIPLPGLSTLLCLSRVYLPHYPSPRHKYPCYTYLGSTFSLCISPACGPHYASPWPEHPAMPLLGLPSPLRLSPADDPQYACPQPKHPATPLHPPPVLILSLNLLMTAYQKFILFNFMMLFHIFIYLVLFFSYYLMSELNETRVSRVSRSVSVELFEHQGMTVCGMRY